MRRVGAVRAAEVVVGAGGESDDCDDVGCDDGAGGGGSAVQMC